MDRDQSISKFKAKRFSVDGSEEVNDILTSECVLQISVNEKTFSMTMRTPGEDKALVRGLLYSEKVLGSNVPSYRFQTACIDENGNSTAVNVFADASSLEAGFESERALVSVSSCGICGKQDSDDIMPEGDALKTDFVLSASALTLMFDQMSANQTTFLNSGGSHAAACFDRNSNMLTLKEDIGRHNAVDKVIGQLILDKKLESGEILLVSGRISFEIITKAHRAGFAFLAAVSAPSSLAVEMAQELGISLLGFCREDKCTVYSHIERVRN